MSVDYGTSEIRQSTECALPRIRTLCYAPLYHVATRPSIPSSKTQKTDPVKVFGLFQFRKYGEHNSDVEVGHNKAADRLQSTTEEM